MAGKKVEFILHPLRTFLKIFGLDLGANQKTCSQFSQRFGFLWTFLWVVISLQYALYTLIKLAIPNLIHSLYISVKGVGSQMNVVTAFLAHVNGVSAVIICHWRLLFNLPKVSNIIIAADTFLNDHNYWRRFSILGIIGIVLSIGVNCGLSISWEMLHPLHVNKTTSEILFSVRYAQKIICYSLYSFFTWSSVTLYLFFGHILLNRYRNAWYSMGHLSNLDGALYSLHQLFGSILLTVCCSGIGSMITSSYYLIRSVLDDRKAFVFIWNAFQIIESLSKVVLICWMADRLIRLPAKEFISVLRRIRDRLSMNNIVERTKMTFYIVEMSQRRDKTTILTNLLGILPLSNRLIPPIVQTVLSFLVVLHQFKMLEKKD